VSPRLVIQDPDPRLSAHGFRDFSKVCHPATVWLIQFGIE
jgi:hypothetical protein